VTDIKPGLYDGLDEAEYHGHKGSVSVSGAKKLLPPSCPAIFKHERDQGQQQRDVFDFGKAAHKEALGVGPELVVVDADNWMTKAAKEAKAAAYADGSVPLLAKDKAAVDAMGAALRAHPIASALLDPDHGKPEQSGFFSDLAHGVLRRFRLDWLPDTDGGRLIVPDYKSAVSAEPGAIRKAVANYGYYMQDAWYRDGCHALGLAEDVAFVFIFQEKTAPYLVTVVELDTEAVLLGRKRNDQALQVFAECTATDTWPGYTSDVELISLPKWATYDLETAA
jgi:hypothetical protein